MQKIVEMDYTQKQVSKSFGKMRKLKKNALISSIKNQFYENCRTHAPKCSSKNAGWTLSVIIHSIIKKLILHAMVCPNEKMKNSKN